MKTTREELRADLRWMLNKVPEVTRARRRATGC
jgi:hypothetical protein